MPPSATAREWIAINIVGIFLVGQPPWTKEGQLDLLGVAVLLLILYIVYRGKRRQHGSRLAASGVGDRQEGGLTSRRAWIPLGSNRPTFGRA
jgi:hypothetical protein